MKRIKRYFYFIIIYVLHVELNNAWALKFNAKCKGSQHNSIFRSPISNNFLTSFWALNHRADKYDTEKWGTAFNCQLEEFQYDVTDVHGLIPFNISGTLFRNRPARFSRGNSNYGHYLDGDGYISKLSIISNDKIVFSSKFVQTKEYAEENEANKILYRSTFRTQREQSPLSIPNVFDLSNAFDLNLKNLANTNIVYWAGKLFTLFEAGVPYEVNPKTLQTIGPINLGIPELKKGLPLWIEELHRLSPTLYESLFGACMTAHPKIDRIRNRLIGWSWRARPNSIINPLDTSPVLEIHEWDSAMKTVGSTQRRVLPDTSVAPHDFSFTENYYVFIENRVSGNTIPYVLGGKCPAQCVDIIPNLPMILNIFPRDQCNTSHGIDLRPLRIPLHPGFTIHSPCAFESGGTGDNDKKTISLITSAWLAETVSSGEVKGGLLGSWEGSAPVFDNIPATLLYHTVVDLQSGQLISHAPVRGLEKLIIEHPHINPVFEGRQVRYIYSSIGSPNGISTPPTGYMRYDLVTGNLQTWYGPENTFCEEVVVTPKSDFDSNFFETSEEDVWLWASMYDSNCNRSCVAIFDGQRIADGPVCTIWLDNYLPHSLHGCFTTQTF